MSGVTALRSFMGTGKLQELRGLCEALDASTVIFDHDLAPKQIANIEEATGRRSATGTITRQGKILPRESRSSAALRSA